MAIQETMGRGGKSHGLEILRPAWKYGRCASRQCELRLENSGLETASRLGHALAGAVYCAWNSLVETEKKLERMMQIVKYPHPVLRQVCRPLKRVDAELKNIIAEMFPLMYATNGVGLAANQVGLPYRFFVMNPTGKAENKDQEYVFINPQIQRGSGKPVCGEEGCLSFPELYLDAIRAPKVTISAYNQHGVAVRMVFEGFSARIVQHEYDHLDGISFFQRGLPDDEATLDALDKLQKEFRTGQQEGTIPSDAEIQAEIARLVLLRTRFLGAFLGGVFFSGGRVLDGCWTGAILSPCEKSL